MSSQAGPHITSSRRGGLTLIELLCVVGIIALLAGVLYPVVRVVKANARASACVSNLHQLHIALEAYLQDNDEFFPVAYKLHADGTVYSWREAAWPYIRNHGVLRCPEASDSRERELPPWARAHYAMNAWLSDPDLSEFGGYQGRQVQHAQVADPSKTIELADAGYSNHPCALDWDHFGWIDIQEQAVPGARHFGQTNFCFVDGHVSRLPEAATRQPEYLWDLQ